MMQLLLLPMLAVLGTDPSLQSRISMRNDARRQHHADADVFRNQLLDKEMECSVSHARSLSRARSELQVIGADVGCQPALGPVLLGIASLLVAQSHSAQCQFWIVERAALLNCGDDLMRRIVRLVVDELGCVPLRSHAHLESGMKADDTTSRGLVAFCVDDDQWLNSELLTLAALLKQLASRQPIGRLPVGHVHTKERPWKPRTVGSWRAWFLATLTAWRERWAGVRH
jgi:hypothetical protein